MEPNKLETQINNNLKTREIQPSSMAWDRLDAMLTAAEENTSKRFIFFSNKHIGIAASILLLVSLGTFYFSTKDDLIKPENNVVIGNINRKSNLSPSKLVSVKKEEQVVGARYYMPQTHFKVSQKVAVQTKTTVNSVIIQDKEIEFQSNEVIAQNQFPKVVESSQEILVSNTVKVNVLDLLAAVDKSTNSNTNSKIKINANSLLSQVDGELDQTFREKALKRISKNYKEIKVALQARNQK
ncbi:hypothetical protein [Flavobacterium sp.]|uniref:hypothetical protein n=1 Tax=Flavobacterium sp. TaxID=239 RepID=UPI0033422611